MQRAFQIPKRDASCDLNCSGGKNSLLQRQRRIVKINTAAISSQPENLGNVTLPFSFCICNKNEGLDKLPSKVLLTLCFALF